MSAPQPRFAPRPPAGQVTQPQLPVARQPLPPPPPPEKKKMEVRKSPIDLLVQLKGKRTAPQAQIDEAIEAIKDAINRGDSVKFGPAMVYIRNNVTAEPGQHDVLRYIYNEVARAFPKISFQRI